VALVVLGMLTAFLVLRGIVPALTRVDSDFPGYLTAARIVADHGNTERLYDIPWFQEQMHRYGIGKPSEGKFQPFPPPTALLLLPVASLAPLDALRVVTAVSAVCLIGSIVLLSRILAWSLIDTALVVLLSGWAVVNTFRLGQPYILVALSCIAGYYAYLRSRPWLAGMCFGLFTPVKYFPVVILGYFAFRQRWRIVAGGALAILAVVLASIAILGWPLHEQFLSSVIGNHLIGQLTMQDPFTATFQSFDSLFRRLFLFDATENPHPWLIAPMLHPAAVVVTKGAILLATIATLIRLWRAPDATAPAVGLLGLVTLLLAPGTGTYHLVLLWLPVGLMMDYLLRQGSRGAYVLLGCYALIGYFPYGHSSRFEGRGVLTVLAYPRLFLLLAMFLAGVYSLWNRTPGGRSPPTADAAVL
jgi:Glycosyltransferase family 87